MVGTQETPVDPRNAQVLVYLNGDLVPRAEATISVFDAGFLLGDGLFENFRLHRGRLLFAERHVERLYAGARAIDLDIGMAREDLIGAVELTCTANRMTDGAHVRLVVTRGLKATPTQDPRQGAGRPTIVIIAEHRQPSPQLLTDGARLATVAMRSAPADAFDMRLNALSRLNLVAAQIQALNAGADEALLLDPRGFVSSAAAANVFVVRNGTVYTSTGAYCLNGITRANVIELCDANRIPCFEADIPLADAYAADEVFLTGTLGGVTPVAALDGRGFGRIPGPVTARIRRLYEGLMDKAAGL